MPLLGDPNVLTVTKTRVPPLKRAVVAEPGPEVAQKILDWLDDGTRLSSPGTPGCS